MKSLIYFVPLFLGLTITNAQVQKTESAPYKKENYLKMSPNEKRTTWRQYKQNILIKDLAITEKNQEQFKTLYKEYQDTQRTIKDLFQRNFEINDLSEKEANQKLEESFKLAQALLDNRKAYAKKFSSILSQKQILQMFQTEGRIRNLLMDKRNESCPEYKGHPRH